MLDKVANGAARVAAAMPVVLRDCAGLAGVGLIAYGAWLFHPAAGFITGGALLLTGAVLVSIKRG